MEETAEEARVPLVTHENKILHSIPSNVEVHINNHQPYNSNGLYAHKSYTSINCRGGISKHKGVLHCEGATIKNSLMKLWKFLCLNLFHKENEID